MSEKNIQSFIEKNLSQHSAESSGIQYKIDLGEVSIHYDFSNN